MALCDIDIDVNCDECYEVSRADNDLNFIYGLTPSTQYYLWVIDKFRNVYRNLFTSGVDGSFDITLSNYPNGMFNKYAGVFELFISTDMDGADVVPLTIYATEYNCILLSITSSTEISCETPNTNNCLPAIVNDGGTLHEVESNGTYTCTFNGDFNIVVNQDGVEVYNEAWNAANTNIINLNLN